MPLRNPGRLTTATALSITGSSAGKGIFTGIEVVQAKNSGNWPSVPGAPTSVTATGGDTAAIITFTPPNNGGYEITQYTVTSNPGNITATGVGSGITITGLTNGVSYTFTVTATNLLGTGPSSSASNSVTPAVVIFPTAYQSLIDSWNGTLKLFVNAETGSDTLNTGLSANSPFATIEKAMTYRNANLNSSQSCMIVIYPGTYTATPSAYQSASFALSDLRPSDSTSILTTFVCAPKRTIIQWTAGSQRDCPVVQLTTNNSKVYGATLLRNNNGKGSGEPYIVAFFNGTTAGFQGLMYNCVIAETNASNRWSLQYDNSSSMTGKVYNCSFYVGAAGMADYSGGSTFTVDKSVFNWTYGTTNATITNGLILTNHDMNGTTYASPGTTTQGVYYGTYAWPA